MTQTVVDPEPFDFLASAEAAHARMGMKFAPVFDYWFSRQHVHKTPDYFFMGGDDPHGRKDAWYIWWVELAPSSRLLYKDVIGEFLKFMPHYRPYIGWARGIRGSLLPNYYSTKRFIQFTDSDHGRR